MKPGWNHVWQRRLKSIQKFSSKALAIAETLTENFFHKHRKYDDNRSSNEQL